MSSFHMTVRTNLVGVFFVRFHGTNALKMIGHTACALFFGESLERRAASTLGFWNILHKVHRAPESANRLVGGLTEASSSISAK